MTVKELIKELKKIDPDRLVIMSSDPEGNCYHKLSGYGLDIAETEDNYEYELLMVDSQEEDSVLTTGVKVLVFFPE